MPEPQGPPARAGLPLWLLVSLAWIGPAILAVFQSVARSRLDNSPVEAKQLVFEGGDWLLYALLTPFVFWMGRRFRLSRGVILQRLPVHVIAAVTLTAGWALGGILLSWVLSGGPPYGGSPLSWILTSLPFGLAVYFAVLGVEHAAWYFAEAREREASASRLAAQLSEARLGALRMQMQPHFLLNSLNAITVIVRDRDTVTATRMLEHLGEMLQRVMRSDRRAEDTLARELEFIEQYLAIEGIRFADRLSVRFDVPDQLRAALVPEFILQPLVENAVRHAVAVRSEPTSIEVSARREGDDLVLEVVDDGPGPGRLREGVGIGNTRERLQTQFGDRASLVIEPAAPRGTRATVRLPWRVERPGA